jgi:hypothetical protein
MSFGNHQPDLADPSRVSPEIDTRREMDALLPVFLQKSRFSAAVAAFIPNAAERALDLYCS